MFRLATVNQLISEDDSRDHHLLSLFVRMKQSIPLTIRARFARTQTKKNCETAVVIFPSKLSLVVRYSNSDSCNSRSLTDKSRTDIIRYKNRSLLRNDSPHIGASIKRNYYGVFSIFLAAGEGFGVTPLRHRRARVMNKIFSGVALLLCSQVQVKTEFLKLESEMRHKKGIKIKLVLVGLVSCTTQNVITVPIFQWEHSPVLDL